MNPLNKTVRIALIVAVAVAAAAAGVLTRQSTNSTAAAAELADDAHQALFSITLPDLEGRNQSLEQWQGKVLVVNFWATWCPPCIKEIPEFAAVSRRHADGPVQFVGISIDRLEAVRQFASDYDVPYPLLIGAPNTLEVARAFGNTAQALPFTVIVGRDGKISEVKLGTLSESDLERRIQALL